jgi:hypothetical protein
MTDIFASTEQFWDNILSCEAERIRIAFETIDGESQQAVLNHLQDMAAGGDGWQPGQRLSALAALETLGKTY